MIADNEADLLRAQRQTHPEAAILDELVSTLTHEHAKGSILEFCYLVDRFARVALYRETSLPFYGTIRAELLRLGELFLRRFDLRVERIKYGRR